MSVSSATVRRPESAPSRTIVVASSRASSTSGRKAPEPNFTSSTRPFAPSAIFLLMIEEAMSGTAATVPVTSRRAYILRSAGARPEPAAQITPPMSVSIAIISSFVSDARHPGIDSSLSSVPPVCPRPRPESCGTATPSDASSGTSGRVILSPTPPVECLSIAGRPSSVKSIRSPLAIMASVIARISSRSMPRITMAMSSALICSGATTPRVNASMSHAISSGASGLPCRFAVMRSTTSCGSTARCCSMPPA